jgi:hypothetical protein
MVLSSLLACVSVEQVLEILGQYIGVLEVVRLGLQLMCVIILKPQVVACDVAVNLVPPSVAVAHDGVLAVVCVECVHS